MLVQKRFESKIFLLNLVTLTGGFCEGVLEAQHFLLKSLDVYFFALSVRSDVVSTEVGEAKEEH